MSILRCLHHCINCRWAGPHRVLIAGQLDGIANSHLPFQLFHGLAGDVGLQVSNPVGVFGLNGRVPPVPERVRL